MGAGQSSLSESQVGELSEKSHFAQEEVQNIWKEWKKLSKEEAVRDNARLVEVARKLGILKLLTQVNDQFGFGGDSAVDYDSKLVKDVLKDKEIEELIADNLFRMLDRNSDGQIDFEEIILGLSILAKGSWEDKARLQFKVADHNGDGFISRDEMKTSVRRTMSGAKTGFKIGFLSQSRLLKKAGLSKERIEHMANSIGSIFQKEELINSIVDLYFEHADSNKDNMISYEEYVKFMSNNAELQKFKQEVTEATMKITAEIQSEITNALMSSV